MQAKRVLRYLAGSINKGVEYPKNIPNLHIWAHTDSDWAGCKTTRRSTSGYAIFLDKGPICWRSKMQSIVALSSCEAEYIMHQGNFMVTTASSSFGSYCQSPSCDRY